MFISTPLVLSGIETNYQFPIVLGNKMSFVIFLLGAIGALFTGDP